MDSATQGYALTDLHMPGLDGLMLIDKIRKVSSDIPVIVMTGNTNHQNVAVLREHGVPVLEKPFRCKEPMDILEKSMNSSCP